MTLSPCGGEFIVRTEEPPGGGGGVRSCLVPEACRFVVPSLRVYQLETGLSRHPEERPGRRDRRDELISTVETALHVLNGPRQHAHGGRRRRTYSPADFVEGEKTETFL